MKKMEWFLAVTLIIIGLSCLTVCATMWGSGSIRYYVTTLMHICFWIGLPGLILGALYVLILMGRKKLRRIFSSLWDTERLIKRKGEKLY